MSNNNICVIVPARGGSKGIPQKNIKVLGKEPLVCWAIKVAQDLGIVNTSDIYLSTDCAEIENIGRDCGAQIIKRPASLAQDNSTVISMIDHHLALFKSSGHNYDIVVYLEPTSPFRTKEEVLKCIYALKNNNYDSVATFAETSFEIKNLLIEQSDGSLITHPNLEASISSPEKAYVLSGAVYAFSIASYLEHRPTGIYFGNQGHVVQTSPHIDIDEPHDLNKAKNLLYSLIGTYWNKLNLV